MYTYNLKLHVENTSCPPQIQLTETDDVQNVVVEVEGVDLSNKTAQVYIQKPDGHMIYNNCVVSDNTITFKVTSQMTAANGIAPADIIIYNSNGEKLHTMRFSLYIFPKLEDDSAIESTDEFTALDEALKQAQSIDEKQDKLISGVNIKTINNKSLLGSGNLVIQGGSGGTSDYDMLENRPQINSVTLTGNQTSAELKLQDEMQAISNQEIDTMFFG